ncbi:asparaginyl-tRNA synthetase [Aulographum hederae CBS 113979]|uniref:asparagine--tRNA ligase n=1 Tax=Aulographum hederae CBS 113979 TaxID=1176131 RepID=A0A6G1GRV9_9PEZI|nr:asparaginyl-tRNA synthetase [Aulographum hederae CBS 113979]
MSSSQGPVPVTAPASDLPSIYVDEVAGTDDDSSDLGTQEKPHKSLSHAYFKTEQPERFSYLVRKEEDGEWLPAAKAAMKKAVQWRQTQLKKASKGKEAAAQQEKEAAERQKILEEAKKIKVEEDSSLPAAKPIKMSVTDADVVTLGTEGQKGTRVRVWGRVHTVRKQSQLVFVVLRASDKKLQCLFSGQLAKTYDILTLTPETCLEVFGEMRSVPSGQKAPDDRELIVDYYEISGKAPEGDDSFATRIPLDPKTGEVRSDDKEAFYDIRHLVLRTELASSLMRVRSATKKAFRQVYQELDIEEADPPALVQTQCEGGSTLFEFDYYGQKAYLTQSSQLYLETLLPSLGDCYCIEKSFRAEKSLTRRHLSEYLHVEAELDFIQFTDLLAHIEHIICRVIDILMAQPAIKSIIEKLHPEFKPPQRPFMRMKYAEAIDWLRDEGILTDEGKPHEFGDDIAEAAERRMTDKIGKPILLTHFPGPIKSFYMPPDAADPRVTESVDVLMPGVGEIVGGSMRIYDYEQIIAAYKRDGFTQKEIESYFWYTDQRKYGGSPHGGYGLGLERFIAWLCKQHTVRETTMYPRYMGRCKP